MSYLIEKEPEKSVELIELPISKDSVYYGRGSSSLISLTEKYAVEKMTILEIVQVNGYFSNYIQRIIKQHEDSE
jgi:hypothetical protein